ncbi:hypothetical protein KDA_64710 [Dictyobacter alpinus]|uniref:Uncharacterized protein n=1 Tax=Dictyobacter alpinus TaxID=2014873 RepID=A0A402BIB2_9CHLR|nr:zinc-ribbon domain-containing protein [Dictyobacter alpinus]GCE30987.1 hypothetical protein KDA_64710 [Dictyobacter alpinus]
MSQSTTHTCTHCHASIPGSMSFCPHCGTPASASYAPTQKIPPNQRDQPPLQSFQPPLPYARPQKNSSRGILKVGIILLLLLLLLGTGGFFAFRYIASRASNTTNSAVKSQAIPAQAPLTTTPINAMFNYASVTITIVSAQQATSFANDRNTPAHGVVRLNLHAIQSDANNVYFASAPPFSYPESFDLLLPGGNKVTTGGYKDLTGPARKGDQTTWIDFPSAAGLKVDQMILQIGKDTEEQIQVPLTGHANLSQYQPKQSAPNLRVAFGSMFWTLKAVTWKLSDSGTQVEKGKRFLVLTLSLDNPGSEGYSAFPPDFIRLEYGGTTSNLEQAVIGDAAAGATNIPGRVSFVVPQETTSATFILLPGHTPDATNQATIPFQVP